MESLQYIYQDLWEMHPVSYCVFVSRQAKHMQLPSTYAYYSQFGFSKARNAPKKKLTTSRLDLMSVLIGTKSLRFVVKATKLENGEKILWTDSQYVLLWIKNKENTSVFVRNRNH